MSANRFDRSAAALLAIAAGLPLLGLALWARFAAPAAWEVDLVGALGLGDDPAAGLVRGINALGDLPIWGALVAVIAAGIGAARGVAAAALVALSFAADLAAFAIKLLVERARPETIATEHFFGADSFAFPSGHVVRAVALTAAVLWLLAPAHYRLPFALGGALAAGLVMGYSRVALGVHWPTDALGGLLLGIAWFAITAWLVYSPPVRRKPS